MAKRIQNQIEEEERVVSKSRLAAMNMSSYFIATSSSAASSPIASKSGGDADSFGETDGTMSLEPSSFDPASPCQVRLKDAYLGRFDGRAAERPVASILRPEPGSTKEKLLPKTQFFEAVFSMVRKIHGKQPGEKRHGTKLALINQTESGTKLQQ